MTPPFTSHGQVFLNSNIDNNITGIIGRQSRDHILFLHKKQMIWQSCIQFYLFEYDPHIFFAV